MNSRHLLRPGWGPEDHDIWLDGEFPRSFAPRSRGYDEANPQSDLVDLGRFLRPPPCPRRWIDVQPEDEPVGPATRNMGDVDPLFVPGIGSRLPRTIDRSKRPPTRLLAGSWWASMSVIADAGLQMAVEQDQAVDRMFLLLRSPDGPVGPHAEAAVYNCLVLRSLVVLNYGACAVAASTGERFWHYFRVACADGSLPTPWEVHRVFRLDPFMTQR
jgi:hypothetical protein